MAAYGDRQTGTKVETPDTAKREPNGGQTAPYPDVRQAKPGKGGRDVALQSRNLSVVSNG